MSCSNVAYLLFSEVGEVYQNFLDFQYPVLLINQAWICCVKKTQV